MDEWLKTDKVANNKLLQPHYNGFLFYFCYWILFRNLWRFWTFVVGIYILELKLCIGNTDCYVHRVLQAGKWIYFRVRFVFILILPCKVLLHKILRFHHWRTLIIIAVASQSSHYLLRTRSPQEPYSIDRKFKPMFIWRVPSRIALIVRLVDN